VRAGAGGGHEAGGQRRRRQEHVQAQGQQHGEADAAQPGDGGPGIGPGLLAHPAGQPTPHQVHVGRYGDGGQARPRQEEFRLSHRCPPGGWKGESYRVVRHPVTAWQRGRAGVLDENYAVCQHFADRSLRGG